MPALPGEAVQTLQECIRVVQCRNMKYAQKCDLYQKKFHFEKLNDNRPGHIYVKCPKFAHVPF